MNKKYLLGPRRYFVFLSGFQPIVITSSNEYYTSLETLLNFVESLFFSSSWSKYILASLNNIFLFFYPPFSFCSPPPLQLYTFYRFYYKIRLSLSYFFHYIIRFVVVFLFVENCVRKNKRERALWKWNGLDIKISLWYVDYCVLCSSIFAAELKIIRATIRTSTLQLTKNQKLEFIIFNYWSSYLV